MLEITDHESVREVRLARPPANALNLALVTELQSALSEAADSADGVVVSGLPGMFSAGLDVPELIQYGRDGLSRAWQAFIRLSRTIARLRVPCAFALTGHAPAGGIVLALYADYRIMARGFKTGLNEVQVGLVVPVPIHRALVRAVGAHTAEKILVSGEMMESEKALRIGLVDELADDAEATVKQAVDWCRGRAASPRPAMLGARAMARADLRELFDDRSRLGVESFVENWFSDATQQSLHALVKRLKQK